MRLVRQTVVVAFALALPAAAHAQLPVQEFQYTGHSGVVAGNVYVGAYTANLGGAAFDVFCVDGLIQVKTTAYDVYVTSVASPNIGTGQYSNHADADVYARAAWLSMQFGANSTSSWGAIHQAIWNLTGGLMAGVNTNADATAVASWEAQAWANYQSVDLTQWSVLHAVEPVKSQEFLVRKATPVSEPMGWLLLATGLLAVTGIVGRRRLA